MIPTRYTPEASDEIARIKTEEDVRLWGRLRQFLVDLESDTCPSEKLGTRYPGGAESPIQASTPYYARALTPPDKGHDLYIVIFTLGQPDPGDQQVLFIGKAPLPPSLP